MRKFNDFKGSMPAPKYQHGEMLAYGRQHGEIFRRSYENNHWRYGLLVDGMPMMVWVSEP